MAKSYRVNFIESNDKFTFQYVLKILDGWDHNVTDQVANKKKNIYHDLKVSRSCSQHLQAVKLSISVLFLQFSWFETDFFYIR